MGRVRLATAVVVAVLVAGCAGDILGPDPGFIPLFDQHPNDHCPLERNDDCEPLTEGEKSELRDALHMVIPDSSAPECLNGKYYMLNAIDANRVYTFGDLIRWGVSRVLGHQEDSTLKISLNREYFGGGHLGWNQHAKVGTSLHEYYHQMGKGEQEAEAYEERCVEY